QGKFKGRASEGGDRAASCGALGGLSPPTRREVLFLPPCQSVEAKERKSCAEQRDGRRFGRALRARRIAAPAGWRLIPRTFIRQPVGDRRGGDVPNRVTVGGAVVAGGKIAVGHRAGVRHSREQAHI